MSKANTIVIHAGDQLRLHGADLETELLIVHLSRPATRIELAGHHLRFDQLELIGRGEFEVTEGGEVVKSWRD